MRRSEEIVRHYLESRLIPEEWWQSSNYRTDSDQIKRKREGCDYRIKNGPLVEVKTNCLQVSQWYEILLDWQFGERALLFFVGKGVFSHLLLKFELSDIIWNQHSRDRDDFQSLILFPDEIARLFMNREPPTSTKQVKECLAKFKAQEEEIHKLKIYTIVDKHTEEI